MCSADLEQYGKLLKDLQNDFSKRNSKYPKDMTETIFMIMNYKQTHSNQPAHIYNDSEGLKFSQNGRSPPPNNIKNKCYNFGVVGHISWECPEQKARRDNSKAKVKCDNRKEVCIYEGKKGW